MNMNISNKVLKSDIVISGKQLLLILTGLFILFSLFLYLKVSQIGYSKNLGNKIYRVKIKVNGLTPEQLTEVIRKIEYKYRNTNTFVEVELIKNEHFQAGNEDYLLLTFYKPKKNKESISTIKNQILNNIKPDIEDIVKNVNPDGQIEITENNYKCFDGLINGDTIEETMIEENGTESTFQYDFVINNNGYLMLTTSTGLALKPIGSDTWVLDETGLNRIYMLSGTCLLNGTHTYADINTGGKSTFRLIP